MLPNRAILPHPSDKSAWLGFPLGLVVLLLAWEFTTRQLNAPYILPAPALVLDSFVRNLDRIAWHAQATLAAVVGGFAIGFALAVVLGYAVSHSTLLERILMPYIVASQAVPVVAVTPLLVYFLGSGLQVRVAAAALIVFFPMLINTIAGLRNIDPSQSELMRHLSASRWQTLRWLEIPAGLPVLLAGLKVGVTLSVIGAVVGEFLGADRGLGVLVNTSRGVYNQPLVFAALFTLVAMACLMYAGASVLERFLLRHR